MTTTGPFGAADPARAGGRVHLGPPPPSPKHDAGPLTQLLVFALAAVALGALAFATTNGDVFTYGLVALAGGVIIGLAVDLTRVFKQLPGALAALLVVVALFAVWAILETRAGGLRVNPAPILLVGLVVLGLDWRWIERLRPLIALAGLFVLPAMSSKVVAALPFALAWFALGLAAYWSCERDLVRASPRLQPLVVGTEARPINSTVDLVRIAGIALVVGLGLALLIGNPSCSRSTTTTGGSMAGGAGGAGGAGSGGAGGAGGGPILLDENGLPIDGGGVSGGGGASGGGGSGGGGASGGRTGRGGVGDIEGRSGRGGNGGLDGSGGAGSGGAGLDPGEAGGGSAGGFDPADPDAAAGAAADEDQPLDLRGAGLLALLLLAIAVAVAVAWPAISRWLRAPVEQARRSWAQAFARRLEHEGAIRGRPRRRGETVLEYSQALADGVLPDERIRDAGRILSAALFRATAPDPAAQAWADGVLDETTAAHPPPTRRERVKARARGAASTPAPA